MLLSPSPAIQAHAQNALASIYPPSPELPAHAQLRGLIYAVRWETGIASSEFLGSILEGERWLVWAAGNVRYILYFIYSDRA
jgi:trafficking protein particle complex subunit 8